MKITLRVGDLNIVVIEFLEYGVIYVAPKHIRSIGIFIGPDPQIEYQSTVGEILEKYIWRWVL